MSVGRQRLSGTVWQAGWSRGTTWEMMNQVLHPVLSACHFYFSFVFRIKRLSNSRALLLTHLALHVSRSCWWLSLLCYNSCVFILHLPRPAVGQWCSD